MVPRQSGRRTLTDGAPVRADRRRSAWIFRSAAVSLSLVLLANCVDVTRPSEASRLMQTGASPGTACPPASLKGRLAKSTTGSAVGERRLAVGDTLRLARLSVPQTAITATGWRADHPDIARIEGDLVIAVAPGTTRITSSTAGRSLCVALTTVFAGAVVSALDIEAPTVIPATDTSAQFSATLRFSNGAAIRVREAATWTSLTPQVANVSAGARLEPKQAGVARIVASIGGLADTVTVQLSTDAFEAWPSARAEDFVASIGVNIHLSYFDRVYGSHFRSVIVPRLQELGVRHLRDGGTTLPNDDWMREVYGRWRETAEATGAQFTIIMSPRRTATGPGTNYGDMSHVAELRARIGDAHIAAWEGLNEHDLSGRPDFPADVRTLQQALYATIKRDPISAAQQQVIGPSIANVSTASRIGDLSAFMDAGAVHPYDGGKLPASNLRSHLDGMQVVNAGRPVWATEVGYHTASAATNPWHWALSESAQAKYTTRQFLELFNAGVRRAFAYELIDQGLDAADMEQQFGLLRNDGSRKPAFLALRNLITLLSDRGAPAFLPQPLTLLVTGDTVGIHRLVLQKHDGRRYLVLWQNSRSYDEISRVDVTAGARPITITFDTPQRIVSIFAPNVDAGASTVFRDVRTLNLSVPDHPVVVELVR